MNSESPASSYAELGFHIFRDALAQEPIAAIHGAVQRDVFPSTQPFLRHPSGQYEPHRYMEIADGSGRRVICNALLDPHKARGSESLRAAILELICNDRVADHLKILDGEGVYSVHQVILFLTPPGTDIHIDGWGLDTHPYGHAHTVWVPLEPVTLTNGAIVVVPWRHGHFLPPTELGLPELSAEDELWGKAYHRYHAALLRYIRVNHLPFVVPQLDPGDFIVFSSLTPHGTLPFRPQTPSRMATQVLVTPTRLPWGDILSGLAGRYRGVEGEPVNERWHA
jgi:hypothetical protein